MARMNNAQLQEELDRLTEENARLRESQRDEADRLAEESARLEEAQQLEAVRLAAENEQLRRDLEDARSRMSTQPIEPLAPEDAVVAVPAPRKRRTSRWWTVLSVGLILIGLVLAPVAVAGTWLRTQLTDTNAFVATFAPLADDPAVQQFITDEVVAVINEQVDIQGVTDQVFNGIEQLGLPPAAAKALDLLREPAVAGIQTLIGNVVERLVTSDAFAAVWAQALRVSHEQLIATLQGDTDAALTIEGNGEIGVQLGPIIEEVKKVLVANGIAFASNIPVVNKTIVIAQSDAVVLVQLSYRIAVAVGTWLPWVALIFLAAGVLVARRRVYGLLGASIGLGIVMIALASGIAIGELVFIAVVSPSMLPSDAAGDIYAQLTQFIASSAVAVAVLAITVAVITWLAGPFRAPRALRSLMTGWFASWRRSAEAHGLTTGRFGLWLYRQRVLVRVLIVIGASAVILFGRPITVGLTLWTAVIALLLLAISELLQRPPVDVLVEEPSDTPAALV